MDLSRIEFDDKLEIHEVEPLVTNNPSRRPTESKVSRVRWTFCMLMVGILLGFFLISDSETLRFWEGKGGDKVNDVEEKELEPLPSPLPLATTVSPTVRASTGTSMPYNPTTMTPTHETTATVDNVSDLILESSESQRKEIPPPSMSPTRKVADLTLSPIVTDVTSPPSVDKLVDPTEMLQHIMSSAMDNDRDNPNIDWGAAHYRKPSLVVKPERDLTPEATDDMTKTWGKWEFVDKKAGERPKENYRSMFPNGDIPREKFPPNAWQTDPEYLRDWLDEGLKLIDRSMEAILAEYGHGKNDSVSSLEERMDEMFKIVILQPGESPNGKGLIPEAAWTTEKSFQGLVRRVLHAIMTNDNFNFVLGGHSAAAGHGNHFKQSYAMQFHKIMEPVFALLGVNLTTRNLAQGGLGTLQHALGFRDIYGESIDMMMWDSGMTEGRDAAAIDLFWRQAMISGDKIPFLIANGEKNMLVYYNINVDADISNIGTAQAGLSECTDQIQCEKLPYAVRYMKCTGESASLCKDHKWGSNCWVDRPDVTPEQKQDERPGSQVSWHEGFRSHQLVGRILTMMTLKALKVGLTQWQKAEKFVLPDKSWHVSAYYENIRTKVHEKQGETACFKSLNWSPRFCTQPVRARTEFTPRANPEKTSLTSIIKPDSNGRIPHVLHGMLYTGPDVFNPFTAVPQGSVDVLAIVSNGRSYSNHRRLEITPGLGTEFGSAPAGYCDGTYNAECGRRSSCLLMGHQDARGGILFHSYSGWLVMNLPAVKDGIIMLKLETWHWPNEVTIANGWKSIDNKAHRKLRGGNSNETLSYFLPYNEDIELMGRQLGKRQPPEYCDNFAFEFAIDGSISSWSKDEFSAHSKVPQRVVEIQTILDDPHFTKEPKDVELAIRMTGCGDNEATKKTFSLTHVYFA